MTCYLISRGDDAIAFVTDIGMARAIAHCQPDGDYRVDEVEVDDLAPVRESRPPQPAPDYPDGRYRRRRGRPSGRWAYHPPLTAFHRARGRGPQGRVAGSE
jgi:hypothetical protein